MKIRIKEKHGKVFAAGIFNMFMAFGPCAALYSRVKRSSANIVVKIITGALITLLEVIYVDAGVDCISSALTTDEE